MSLHDIERRLFQVAGSMRNFADVADRCTVTEVVNGPPSIRTWAEMLDEIRVELAALAGGGEAFAWLVLYGDRVVGYVTHESKPYATLAEGETLVPVFPHPAGAVQVTDELVERVAWAIMPKMGDTREIEIATAKGDGRWTQAVETAKAAIEALNPGGSRE